LAGKRIHGNAPTQEFAAVFKRMGINIVHLAEFHRQNEDGHFRNTDSIRLDEMKKMFELYHQYSDDNFLLLPGEEGRWYMANPWPPDPKIDPGHWMSFFPRPVYFTWLRAIGQPFAERIEPYGMVYHLDGREDAIRLLNEQQGLGWTSHPRIKASFATPDAFKDTDFYKSRMWLGAAWKSMPVDLSQDRLGRRPLDLLDDMSNWAIVGGYPLKAMPGEIDLFEIDRTNELYANMNTNYLQLDRLPRGDDWTPVLDALRERKFFTTTGEILIHSFAIHNGKATADLQWTFPLSFVELISGDGTSVHRQHIDLYSSAEFGRQTFSLPIDDRSAKWIRLEACDVARDAAFTQSIDLR